MVPNLPQDLQTLVNSFFGYVTIAEETISEFKHKYPEKVDIIHNSFKYLCPPFRGYDERIYKHYCREILNRVITGDDITRITDAEILISFNKASLKSPLISDAAIAYKKYFKKILPEVELDDELTPNESYPGAVDDLLQPLFRMKIKRDVSE